MRSVSATVERKNTIHHNAFNLKFANIKISRNKYSGVQLRELRKKGITASKKLSAKINFTTGVNYKLFTTSIATGNYSSLNGAQSYSQGNTNRYSNYYHFVEIPLAIQLQLANIKKHPVYFEGGLTFSQLISTNSLQYNVSQSKYYIDNSLFNKTIIGLSAGLFINLASNSKAPLLLGPHFYYSASTIAGSGLYANTHYSFIGINIRKILKKN